MNRKMHFFILKLFISIFIICGLTSCAVSKHDYTRKNQNTVVALENFGHTASRNFNIRFLFEGNYKAPCSTTHCVNFTDTKNIQLKQARALGSQIAKDFFTFIISHPILKTDFIESYDTIHSQESFEQFILKKIGFRIAYWNSNMERPQSPFIAEIQLRDKTLHYYEADPKTQSLRLVFAESYEKAITFNNERSQ